MRKIILILLLIIVKNNKEQINDFKKKFTGTLLGLIVLPQSLFNKEHIGKSLLIGSSKKINNFEMMIMQLSDINNFVHPYNSFDSVNIDINIDGKVTIKIKKGQLNSCSFFYISCNSMIYFPIFFLYIYYFYIINKTNPIFILYFIFFLTQKLVKMVKNHTIMAFFS